MLKIKDGVISLNRGDDVSFTVNLTDEAGNSYEMETGDELQFCVRREAAETSPVLLDIRSITNTIFLRRADTGGMAVGRYSAAIRLLRRSGDAVVVYPELTRHGRERAWNNFLLDPEVVK